MPTHPRQRSLALIALAVGWLGWWASHPVDRTALTIQAPREAERALPVYAQFIVTQSVQLDSAVVLDKPRSTCNQDLAHTILLILTVKSIVHHISPPHLAIEDCILGYADVLF